MKLFLLVIGLLLTAMAIGVLYEGAGDVHTVRIFSVFLALCGGYFFRMLTEEDF